MRSLIIAVLLGLAAVSAAPAAEPSKSTDGGVLLREQIKVNANVIRLGDLFTVDGENASTAVAYAPEPGKRASFDARWLYRVARAYRLNWRPINERVRAVVTRESQIITRAEIQDAILDALAERGVDADMEVEFSNRFVKLHVPGNALGGVAVDEIDFDTRSRRFSAILTAPAGSPQAKQFRITGKLHKTIELPVLNHRVLAGETIKRRDIKWVKVRARRLQPNTIVDEASLVGMTPRRGLRADYPILTSAVRRPVLVEKGSLVTMFLRAPKMTLTAQGKAMEDGSDGDVIRITNTHSNNVVEAEVIGHGRAAVRLTTMLAMHQASGR